MKSLKEYILETHDMTEASFSDWLNLGKKEREEAKEKAGAKGTITKTETGTTHKARADYTGDESAAKKEVDPNAPKRGRGRPAGAYKGEYKKRAVDKAISAAKSAATKAANRAARTANEEVELDEEYKGKHPDKIKEVYGSKESKGTVTVVTNAGKKHLVHAKDTGGKMPNTGEHISKYVKEEAEDIQELSKKTLGSYIKKASKSAADTMGLAMVNAVHGDKDDAKAYIKASGKRSGNINRAVGKLTKEDVEFDELQEAEFKLGDFVKPKIGPHVNDMHKIVHDHGDGSFNIQPCDIEEGKTKYSAGKAKASAAQLEKYVLAKDEEAVEKLSGGKTDKKKLKEEVEDIQELSKTTLGKYIKRSTMDAIDRGHEAGQRRRDAENDTKGGMYKKMEAGADAASYDLKKADKREKGIGKAVARLTKEEVENLDEISGTTLKSYIRMAAVDKNIQGQKSVNAIHAKGSVEDRMKELNKATDKSAKRSVGIGNALQRLTKK